MSKRKQTRTKRNNMDTSLDTSYLFPPYLDGKKLKGISKDVYKLEDHSGEYLEQYLESKKPSYFFKAVKENSDLVFLGKHYYLKERLNRWKFKNSKFVNDYTVVWETINWWIKNLHHAFKPEEAAIIKERLPRVSPSEAKILKKYLSKVSRSQAKIVKKYLSTISPLLALPQYVWGEESTKDGFVHIIPKVKDKHPYLTYRSANDFLNRWHSVRKAFEETKSKKRYNKRTDAQLKIDDAIKAIKKLGDELYEDEVELLDLTNIRTKTASYICLVHENSCPRCKKKGLQYKTILRLYDKARKELNL